MARGSRRTDIRIGHDARAAATGTLDAALREGRFDLAEYERRLVVVQAAKVAEDLTPAVTDLPSRPGQREPGLRISAVDREQALVRLAEALSDGRLEAAEYVDAEELLRRAVSYADVDVVVGDLDARASLAERQQGIERIEAAVAEGLLDPAERHGRVEAVRKATSDAQLAALVADLTTSTRLPDAPVRVSNADREVVAARLHDAVEAGFLDLTEFDERVRAVYAARLLSELERVVADLPAPAGPPEPLPPVAAPVEKPRREWRSSGAFGFVVACGIFGFAGAMTVAGVMVGSLGGLAALPLVVWLIGLVVLVKRARRPVAADPAADPATDFEAEPHVEQPPEQLEQLTEQLNQLTEQFSHITERSDRLAIQFEQLPDLVGLLPPKLAARIAGQFRQLNVSERFERLTGQMGRIAGQVRQLPDQVEQVSPEVVEHLLGQVEQLTEPFEQLAGEVEQLTEQVEQLLRLSGHERR